MAAESIKTRFAGMPPSAQIEELRKLHVAQYDALVAVIAQLAAKLDADAGVTDTNYATLASATIAAKITA